jgi:hypothetical protein
MKGTAIAKKIHWLFMAFSALWRPKANEGGRENGFGSVKKIHWPLMAFSALRRPKVNGGGHRDGPKV